MSDEQSVVSGIAEEMRRLGIEEYEGIIQLFRGTTGPQVVVRLKLGPLPLPVAAQGTDAPPESEEPPKVDAADGLTEEQKRLYYASSGG